MFRTSKDLVPAEVKKNGHIYIRVSSGEQAETGNSIESQRDRCKEYAVRQGITVVDIYIDAGISGSSMRRPEMRRMRDSIKNGEFIIAYAVSRISRSTRDFSALLEWAEERNIVILTVKDPIDTRTAQGVFMTNILSSMSQLEADLTRERMAELNYRRLRRGETTKAPPFGYQSVKIAIGVPARLVPDVLEQEAITQMFILRQQNLKLMSYKFIAEKLTEQGYKSRRGGKFKPESVRQTMTREFEFRSRVHKTLMISRTIVQRYWDLKMPFIVPMAIMENFITRDVDGRETYNCMYEDTGVVVEPVQFFTDTKARTAKRAIARSHIMANTLDLQLLLFDKDRESELQLAHLADNETEIRRKIKDNEAKDFRKILQELIVSERALQGVIASLRTGISEELRMAEIQYRLHVESKTTLDKGYNEHDDAEALILKLNVMQLKKKLSKCTGLIQPTKLF